MTVRSRALNDQRSRALKLTHTHLKKSTQRTKSAIVKRQEEEVACTA